MEQIEKNTVEVKNQTGSDVFFFGSGEGKRVMFVGNSITLHMPKEDIGWNLSCGMAASKPERDYVHRVMNKLDAEGETSYCICQVWQWEQNYQNGTEYLPCYQEAQAFDADLIIMRAVENCKPADFNAERFRKEYQGLISFLNQAGRAQVILTGSFWKHPGDAIIQELAEELGYSYVSLADLGEQERYQAVGCFAHSGVAAHPGDQGMEQIANRILEAICSPKL